MTEGEQVIQAVSDGKTVREIAKEMNKHPATISRWIKEIRKAGYELPLKKGRPKKVIIGQRV